MACGHGRFGCSRRPRITAYDRPCARQHRVKSQKGGPHYSHANDAGLRFCRRQCRESLRPMRPRAMQIPLDRRKAQPLRSSLASPPFITLLHPVFPSSFSSFPLRTQALSIQPSASHLLLDKSTRSHYQQSRPNTSIRPHTINTAFRHNTTPHHTTASPLTCSWYPSPGIVPLLTTTRRNKHF